MARNASPDTRWYAATLLFVSKIAEVESLRPLCEERVVLVRGTREKQVRAVLARYGREQDHAYKNDRGETVEWRYVDLAKLEPIEDPTREGVQEVASRFVRKRLSNLRAAES
jgi:hypothetical protein